MTNDPCFCGGPWGHLPSEERPRAIDREHETGTNGCWYKPGRGERRGTEPEWVRRAQSGQLRAKDMTGAR